ncbi:PLP-dependent aminotransferase family protein [Paraburkholderia pallida]|uniref:PLP-dependent aminotransferase family protein n=1 Tax=Paraburkholderia pallida TaxID=2547399 RepID=A0A4P7D4D9_9BURK|nr:PLP-dependent aminotransferase family protein [Paraburkholderia pallida]QBR02207.1 PLP-dependent aminotransferase family protein [Paraburkholderia pallida]
MYPFSRAFIHPASSPIRDLFKYLSDPEMISFAGGYPDPRLFDVEGLEEASRRAYKDSLSCLQYGNTEGIARLKTEIIRLMEQRGVKTSSENIVVTTGSQQAFDLLLRVLVNPGDVVLVESPTYSSNIQAARVHGARVVPVQTDADGLDVAALERLLDGIRSEADRPKLLYTVPTFGNPTGATLSLQRRLRLLELAVKHRLVIVEDDPYGDLRFSGERIPSLKALTGELPGSDDWVVHMGSLSKIVAPGLRVGWSISPAPIAYRCYIAKQSADVGSSPWTQGIAAEYLSSGALEPHIERIRRGYGEKCRALCAALRELMGDALTFHEPNGGMFVWARLNGEVPAAELLKASIDRKVMFVPGAGFHVDDPVLSTLRLSFAAPSVANIHAGVGRLADAWEAIHARI